MNGDVHIVLYIQLLSAYKTPQARSRANIYSLLHYIHLKAIYFADEDFIYKI